MSRFRKKPVEIEAHQFRKGGMGWHNLNAWLDAVGYVEGDGSGLDACWINDDGALVIPTLEGDMTAQDGDWIIQGVQRELYPCKPDIFAATYEPVSS